MRIIFAGTPDFAVPALDALHVAGHDIAAVYSQPDRRAGRGRQLKASPVAARATQLGLRVEKPAKLDAKAQNTLRALKPEAMIVVAYGLLLPQAVLDIPHLGCLNVHASLLPRWRGAAPIARAIEAGDSETGVCIMQMDAGLDTGPVLASANWPIPAAATAADAHDALAGLGADLLVETLSQITGGTLQARQQSEGGVCYAHKLNKDEARIDWSEPAPVLARRIHAFNPAPVAWSMLGEERIRIWQAQAKMQASQASPGTILNAGNSGLCVATGNGTLRILELQRPGGRTLPAAELLRSWKPVGRQFE